MNAHRITHVTLARVSGRHLSDSSNAADFGEAESTDWQLPPVKPFREVFAEVQTEARDAGEKLGAIYRAIDARDTDTPHPDEISVDDYIASLPPDAQKAIADEAEWARNALGDLRAAIVGAKGDGNG